MYTSTVLTAAVLLILESASAETHLSSASLGVSYEFKLHVDAGKEECFYQYVEQNASVYVSFQVSTALIETPGGIQVRVRESRTSSKIFRGEERRFSSRNLLLSTLHSSNR